MLFADHVVYFATQKGVVPVDEAIFTQRLGACHDQAPKLGADETSQSAEGRSTSERA